ncbi:MAG: hypothetical protein WAL72_33515 [Streptosporangiaceae bacterium]
MAASLVGDVSLALVDDRNRVITVADAPRAKADGYVFIGAWNPGNFPFRGRARSRILEWARAGDLVVPMAPDVPVRRRPRGARDADQAACIGQDRSGQRPLASSRPAAAGSAMTASTDGRGGPAGAARRLAF